MLIGAKDEDSSERVATMLRTRRLAEETRSLLRRATAAYNRFF